LDPSFKRKVFRRETVNPILKRRGLRGTKVPFGSLLQKKSFQKRNGEPHSKKEGFKGNLRFPLDPSFKRKVFRRETVNPILKRRGLRGT